MKSLSRSLRGATVRAACTAVACAVWLSTSSAPLRAEAAVQPVAAPLLAQVTTPHGETVRFTLMPDGSVNVDGRLPASAVPFSARQTSLTTETPLELFHAIAPNTQAPLALIEANTRYSAAHQASAAQKISPALKTAQGPRVGQGIIIPQVYSEQWFINDYCNPPSSYNVCYTNAWSWAYLNSSSVYYGHAVVYAKDAGLNFSVSPVGSWYVPRGYVWWASHYQFSPFGWNNFAFNANVSYAHTFDFEADVKY